MAFEGRIITLAGLAKIELPSYTIRLCDGGFVIWGADTYRSKDAVFGTIESVEPVSEGIGDEAPAGKLTLLPPDVSDAGELFRSDAQGSRIRFWMAEVDPADSTVIGTPELQFDGLVDTITLRVGRQGRFVDIDFMAEAERLFMTREGNVLSSRFHNEAYPTEKGFDFTTGAAVQVPWGAPDPGRSGGWIFGLGGGGFRGRGG